MSMNLKLKKFKPSWLNDKRKSKGGPPTCVIIGKRGTGKTCLIADILYHCRDTPMGVVMSGTEESCEFYGKYVPDIFIYDDYNADVIHNLIQGQRKSIKDKARKGDKSCFILLDDCMYDKKNMRSKDIRGIFMNGRHWRILFLLTMQYCMDLPPDLRANCDYVFALREPVIQNREKLYKSFFGIFPTFNSFQTAMTACTENYECLVLDNSSKSNKIEDVVYWYKAKYPIKKFKVGGKKLWKWSKKNYNKRHETEEKNEKFGIKKKNTITIKKVK